MLADFADLHELHQFCDRAGGRTENDDEAAESRKGYVEYENLDEYKQHVFKPRKPLCGVGLLSHLDEQGRLS